MESSLFTSPASPIQTKHGGMDRKHGGGSINHTIGGLVFLFVVGLLVRCTCGEWSAARGELGDLL